MTVRAYLDVSELDLEEWLRFFFERRLLASHESFTGAFCPNDVLLQTAHPLRIVEHLDALCTRFAEIGRRYPLQQINQGIWAMLSAGEFELQRNLWSSTIPLESRLACIRSMRVPYLGFVAGHPATTMENCFDMWWDLLLGSFWSQHGSHYDYGRLNSAEQRIVDAVFETLDAVLNDTDSRCQGYALHGLGHLHHPGVPGRVGRFIEDHRGELTQVELKWLEQCRDGIVM
jgi:hypothetical protein